MVNQREFWDSNLVRGFEQPRDGEDSGDGVKHLASRHSQNTANYESFSHSWKAQLGFLSVIAQDVRPTILNPTPKTLKALKKMKQLRNNLTTKH